MLGVLIAMFAAALLAPALARLGPKAGLALSAVPAGGALLLALRLASGNVPFAESFAWVPSLGVGLSFYVDGLSLLFALLITVLGTLVVIYSAGYFERPECIGRYYGYLFAFMGGMLGIVTAGNLLFLYLFWEVTTVSSFLLIGFNSEREDHRENARQALLVTALGGLALLAAIILIGEAAGTYEIADLLTRGPQLRSHALYPAIVVLVLAGCFTKSAQVPFHVWLPKAMVAPTPVSAYLHSATMVKAGIFLLWRLQPVLGGHPLWQYSLEVVGAVTMLTGAIVGVAQTDLKRILAYTTISVLGMLVLLTGIGTVAALEAATAYLLVHALYKGALFLVAGALDRGTGTRDVTRLGQLAGKMPLTATAGVLAALSMAGMPPLIGFISKELVYEAKVGAPQASTLITMFGITANMLLVTAAILAGIHPFFGKCKSVYEKAHEVKREMLLGPVLLALLSLLLGFFPDSLSTILLSPAISAIEAQVTVVDLTFWHGIDAILILSILTVAFGVVLYFARRNLRVTATLFRPVLAHTPTAWYEGSMRGLVRVARKHTALLQHGFLAGYLWVVLGCVGAGLLYALLPLAPVGQVLQPALFDWSLVLIFIANSLLLLRVQSRMAAIAGLSALGVAIALFYGVYSGLDLAMVQFSVETLGVVLLLAVLLKLPQRYRKERSNWRIAATGGLAAMTGLAIALVMYQARASEMGSLGAYYAENSVPVGHGRNIVNVILVDFRSLDTLGEAAVVGIAALGAVAMLQKERLP